MMRHPVQCLCKVEPVLHCCCYACSVDVTGKYRNTWNMEYAFAFYERVVEHLESLSEPFSTVGTWRALRGGPKEYNYVKHVIADLRLHGLIRCVDLRPNGKCHAWVWTT